MPSDVICLAQPSLRTLRRLFIASCCYHKFRFDNRNGIASAISAGDMAPESGTLNESYVLVDHYDGDILPVMTKVCK